MNMAERIKTKRKELKLSQTDLADLLGLSYMTVRRWETKGTTPNASLLPKLAEVLDTSVSYLMEGNDNEKTYQETEKGFPSMAYWGGVIDNAKKLSLNGNDEEKNDVLQMLKRACSYLLNMKERNEKVTFMTNVGGRHNENNLNLGMGVV